jgi:hypothetical protein
MPEQLKPSEVRLIRRGDVLVHKPSGTRLIAHEGYQASASHAAGWRCSVAGQYIHSTRGYPLDELEPAPERDHRRGGYDLQEEMVPRLEGLITWESIKPTDVYLMLSNITACAGWTVWPRVGFIQLPGDSRPNTWARYFLPVTQGGGYTGEAFALAYTRRTYRKVRPPELEAEVVERAIRHVQDPKAPGGDLASAVEAMLAAPEVIAPELPTAWKVAICDHDVEDTGTHDGKMRGWHPAHCRKCGLDLSVDSSD